MGWLTGRSPDDPQGLREPFPVSRHGMAESTPLRSPLGMFLTGLGLALGVIALLAWVWTTSLADPHGMPAWQLTLLSLVLLLIPLPILWIGAVRLAWQRRYTRVTGAPPTPYRD